MKRLLATTAIALTAATATVSAQDAGQLRQTVANELATMETNVDVSALSDAQVAELYAAITSTDDSTSEAAVRAIVSDMSMADMDANQLRELVGNELTTMNMDVDLTALTDAEVAELYTAITSSDDISERMSAVRGTLAGTGAVSMDDPEGFIVTLGMDDDQFDETVSQMLVSMGVDADIDSLTRSQKVEIYTLATRNEENSQTMQQIEAIVNG